MVKAASAPEPAVGLVRCGVDLMDMKGPRGLDSIYWCRTGEEDGALI